MEFDVLLVQVYIVGVEVLNSTWSGLFFGHLSTHSDSRKLVRGLYIPYILVYKSNVCISRTLFLKPKIQLF